LCNILQYFYSTRCYGDLQVSDALMYVEKLNAVHRDIAARNVLVAADRLTVKLADFGMSTFLTSDYYRLRDGKTATLYTYLD